jgi:hypothetical protein
MACVGPRVEALTTSVPPGFSTRTDSSNASKSRGWLYGSRPNSSRWSSQAFVRIGPPTPVGLRDTPWTPAVATDTAMKELTGIVND